MLRRPRAASGAALRRPLPRAGPQPGPVPHPGRRQDGHHLHQPPQALPGPLSAASGASPPWMTPWVAQGGHLPLAARRAAAVTPGGAGDALYTIGAVPRAGRCEDAITTWAGARNCFFSPVPGVFCTPGPLPGAAASHTDRAAATRPAAAGQTRPVASSGGAVWRHGETPRRRGRVPAISPPPFPSKYRN
jgi:hypothetical protein